MQLKLGRYTNSSINLVKEWTTVLDLEGYVKNGTDVIRPTIVIEGDYEQQIRTVNYAHIPDFARYYFTGPPRVIRQHLWEIDLRVDVLMSYADRILKQEGIVARSESKWNLNLNDNQNRVYQQSDFQSYSFPSGFDGQSKVLLTIG